MFLHYRCLRFKEKEPELLGLMYVDTDLKNKETKQSQTLFCSVRI